MVTEKEMLVYLRSELRLWLSHPQDTHRTAVVLQTILDQVEAVLGAPPSRASTHPAVRQYGHPLPGEKCAVLPPGHTGCASEPQEYRLVACADMQRFYATSEKPMALVRWARQWTEEITHLYDLRVAE